MSNQSSLPVSVREIIFNLNNKGAPPSTRFNSEQTLTNIIECAQKALDTYNREKHYK